MNEINLKALNELTEWIKAQNKGIKLQFKVFKVYYLDTPEFNEFLETNKIIELEIRGRQENI